MTGVMISLIGSVGGAGGIISIEDEGVIGSPAGIAYHADGSITASSALNDDTWINNATFNTQYQIMFHDATGDTGALSGAAFDTWLDLDADRSITLDVPGSGTNEVMFTTTIRDKLTSVPRDSATIDLASS